MILRTIEEVLNSKNNVEADNWASRRFPRQEERMGYSLSETTIYAGSEPKSGTKITSRPVTVSKEKVR